MLSKLSGHIKKLAQKSKAVEREFCESKEENNFSSEALVDPLLEDQFSPVRGLCHKYPHRVLILLTMDCASFCRFCTRRRRVGDIAKGKMGRSEVGQWIDYVKSKPEINEVVFSGGDPLVDKDLLIYSLDKFSRLSQIKILRVHTRVPVSEPRLLTKDVLASFSKIKKQALYVSLHFEHPDELTEETIEAVGKLRTTGAILLSQSVFLKGVNDSYGVLAKLFGRLAQIGVKPYYIYHCDLVRGAEHFIVPLKREVEIMTKLRQNLSGIAFPFHLIDTPNGSGKIPVPLGFWNFNQSSFCDFNQKETKIH